MSTIESSIGKKSFNTPGRQVFSVADESQFDIPASEAVPYPNVNPVSDNLSSGEFQELQARRQQMTQEAKKLSPEIKARLEALIGTGRMVTDVTIDGFKFTLQSLKAREMKEVAHLAAATSGTDQIYELRTQTLARSLVKINDIKINLVLSSNDPADVINFLYDMQESVLNKLYSVYSDLVKDINDKLNPTKIAEDVKK